MATLQMTLPVTAVAPIQYNRIITPEVRIEPNGTILKNSVDQVAESVKASTGREFRLVNVAFKVAGGLNSRPATQILNGIFRIRYSKVVVTVEPFIPTL